MVCEVYFNKSAKKKRGGKRNIFMIYWNTPPLSSEQTPIKRKLKELMYFI